MKNLLKLLFVAGACLISTACLKGTDKPATAKPVFTGNWSLVSDSTNIQFWGIWSGRADTGITYIGKPADHYNFLASGILYIADGNYLDTVNYVSLPHDTLEIKYISRPWLNPFKYLVSDFTDHTMTLSSAFPSVTPETAYMYVIKLKK